MIGSAKPTRGLFALGLAFALGVGACGGSPSASSLAGPSGTSGLGGSPGPGSSVDNSLVPGLLAGLDKLDSYQFSWTLSTASSDGTPAPGAAPWVSGTVINKGTRSYRINDPGTVQFIVVGSQAWASVDTGKTWTTTDLSSVDAANLMIDEGYSTWFDKNAVGFKMADEESRNGVQCVRYKGDSSLSGLYSSVSGTSTPLTADLWIASDGNYPVSGIFGYSGSIGGKSGGFGYTFDVTHVNDPTNSVVPPANVLVEPTDTPSA
jgi:hypothetical protein